MDAYFNTQCCKCGRINIGGLWMAKVIVNTPLQETYCPRCRKKIIDAAKQVLKRIKEEGLDAEPTIK